MKAEIATAERPQPPDAAERLVEVLRDPSESPSAAEAALDGSISSLEAQDHLPASVRRQLVGELEKQRTRIRNERLLSVLTEFGAVLKSDYGIVAEFRPLKRRRRPQRKPSTPDEPAVPKNRSKANDESEPAIPATERSSRGLFGRQERP